jgi:hypothetical protein
VARPARIAPVPRIVARPAEAAPPSPAPGAPPAPAPAAEVAAPTASAVAAAVAAAPLDVGRLADQVIAQIDRRIASQRERLGRP